MTARTVIEHALTAYYGADAPEGYDPANTVEQLLNAYDNERDDELERVLSSAGPTIADQEARIVELEEELAEERERSEKRRQRLVAAEADLLEIRAVLSPNGEPRKVPMELGERVAPAVEWLTERVAALETWAHGCDAEGCMLPHSSWCERAKAHAAEHDGCTCGRPWEDSPQPHALHCWLVDPPRSEVEEMRRALAARASWSQAAAVAADVGSRMEHHNRPVQAAGARAVEKALRAKAAERGGSRG